MNEPRTYVIRQRLGWPQRKLAEHLGVSQPTVARLEGGRRESGPVRLLLDQLEKAPSLHRNPIMIPQGNTSLPAALAATPPARKAGRGGLSSQEREDRLAFIRAAIARGETLRTIGAALGVSGQSVHAMCARHGIKPAGVPVSQFTSEMRSRHKKAAWADPVKRETWLRARRAAEHVHSKETIRKVVSFKGQKSARKIAEEMGFSSRYVVIGIWHRASRAIEHPQGQP